MGFREMEHCVFGVRRSAEAGEEEQRIGAWIRELGTGNRWEAKGSDWVHCPCPSSFWPGSLDGVGGMIFAELVLVSGLLFLCLGYVHATASA
jgi:hypothetical protein